MHNKKSILILIPNQKVSDYTLNKKSIPWNSDSELNFHELKMPTPQ